MKLRLIEKNNGYAYFQKKVLFRWRDIQLDTYDGTREYKTDLFYDKMKALKTYIKWKEVRDNRFKVVKIFNIK